MDFVFSFGGGGRGGERECEFHDLKMSSLFHFNIKETSEDPNDNLCLKHQNTKVDNFSFLGRGDVSFMISKCLHFFITTEKKNLGTHDNGCMIIYA